MEGRLPPQVFSSDGCYVEVKINREEGIGTGASVQSKFLITVKGTHDTNPETLTNTVYRTLTELFGSPPITMPFAVVSGLIEFSWTGKTSAAEEDLFASLSKAISSSRIRNERSSALRRRPEVSEKIHRKLPSSPHVVFQVRSVHDGRVKWRCVKGDGEWESEEEARLGSCKG